ncbi:Uncharacterised protein [Yersinia frederiksenii]|nr:Uncharacterised protein [Yersinia frederiksenii]
MWKTQDFYNLAAFMKQSSPPNVDCRYPSRPQVEVSSKTFGLYSGLM